MPVKPSINIGLPREATGGQTKVGSDGSWGGLGFALLSNAVHGPLKVNLQTLH